MRLSRRSFSRSTLVLPWVTPLTGAAQVSTPDASPVVQAFDPAFDRASELLHLLPGDIADEILDIAWLDLERQYAQWPELDRLDVLAALPPGALIDDFLNTSMTFLEVELGFAFTSILQCVLAGRSRISRILKVDANTSTLPAAWESAGFEMRESDDGSFWTIGEDGEVDIRSKFQSIALAQLNNIAILDEQTLAFSSTSQQLRQMMAASVGNVSLDVTIVDGVNVGIPDNAVSIWSLDGRNLTTSPQAAEALAESDDAVGAMPVIRSFSTGVTEGTSIPDLLPSSNPQMYMLLQADQPGQAEQVASVMSWRLENFQKPVSRESYEHLVETADVEVINDSLVRCTVAGEPAEGFMFWAMIARDDTWPFVYIPEA